ncbi:MAG: undecaprenyl-diphosphate phosphatase [Bacteroidetes bacterium]|nr:undecaprenyl-diphosphate phosphatase [Bacteroidota bacterium]
MEIIRAVVYGLVQGFTEFLPVSSSGHLELAKAILGDGSMPEDSLLMTVVLHAATALSTVVIFRKDIVAIFQGIFTLKNNSETQFGLKVVISMVPAAAVGLLWEDGIEQLFNKNILLVGGMLLLTGLLLFMADRAAHTTKDVSIMHSFIIGLAQAIAILPGISRSGATIATSVLLGIDRAKAARFSFLMVVPLILGKMAKDIMDGGLSMESAQALPLMAGFSAAFLSGLFACRWMIALVRNSQLKYFSFYCFTIGTLALAYAIFS